MEEKRIFLLNVNATLGASVWENWAAVSSIHRTLCRRVGAIQARPARPQWSNSNTNEITTYTLHKYAMLAAGWMTGIGAGWNGGLDQALYSTDRSEFPTHLLPSVTQSHTHTVHCTILHPFIWSWHSRPRLRSHTYVGVDGKKQYDLIGTAYLYFLIAFLITLAYRVSWICTSGKQDLFWRGKTKWKCSL